MPTYEYRCKTCEQVFEIVQKMSDEKLTVCPDEACKGNIKRAIGTGAGLIFKGSGFYQTDYRSESYQKASQKEAPKSDSPKKETKPTEKKAVSKSTTKPSS